MNQNHFYTNRKQQRHQPFTITVTAIEMQTSCFQQQDINGCNKTVDSFPCLSQTVTVYQCLQSVPEDPGHA